MLHQSPVSLRHPRSPRPTEYPCRSAGLESNGERAQLKDDRYAAQGYGFVGGAGWGLYSKESYDGYNRTCAARSRWPRWSGPPRESKATPRSRAAREAFENGWSRPRRRASARSTSSASRASSRSGRASFAVLESMNGGKPIRGVARRRRPARGGALLLPRRLGRQARVRVPEPEAAAARRRRPDHPVELPAADAGLEDRAGARRRQHRRAEAGRDDAAHGAPLRRRSAPGRAAAGRRQHRHRRRRDRRRARQASRRRQDRLHRLDRGRQGDPARARRHRQEADARARRQGGQHRLRRRRARPGGRGDRQRRSTSTRATSAARARACSCRSRSTSD